MSKELSKEKELRNRYDFMYIFDVKDGNPNGDPDAGNLPRVDAETGCGLVTDVCLKRKVRNFVELKQNTEGGIEDSIKQAKKFDIFIKEKAVLNQSIERAFKEVGLDKYDGERKALKEKLKSEKDENKKGELQREILGKANNELARKRMCSNFYDVRTFGAVMSTGKNAGQVRGPVQFTFGRSVDPILSLEHSITRMAVATEKEAANQEGDNRTIGRKSTVPYGLYVAYGFISANLANQTGFDIDDLELFWEALINMFEHDRSAARGLMSARKLYVFEHSDCIGNAPAYRLFDLIKIEKKEKDVPARNFTDYEITIDKSQIPDKIKLIEKI